MKFINLLKKELTELINAQMIMGLVVSLALFWLMGNVMQSVTSELAEDAKNTNVYICDMDDSDVTHELIKDMESNGAKVNKVTVNGEDYASGFKDNSFKSYVVLPKGFADQLASGEKPEIISVSKLKSASTFSGLTGGTDTTEALINKYVSIEISKQKISSGTILSKITTTNMMLPIIIMVLILMTSQSLIASISNEKIDKTLETLLSAPVSRGSVITAKMLAAAIVALINAGVMMFGFSAYSKGMTGAITSDLGVSDEVGKVLSAGDAMKQLGLNLGVTDYLIVGVQLFITIMICLAISIILGALVNDSKSAQTMLLPIMMMVMIPWFVTMFTDVNSLPTVPKLIVYAIPFTHTFTAIPNLMFGNTTELWIGLVYQIIVFAVVMFFALKLFKSDKILTMSLNFGQKSRFKKKASAIARFTKMLLRSFKL